MLQPINARVFIDSKIIEDEFSYAKGNKKNELVTFVFRNTVTGKETERKSCFTYNKALKTAIENCKDNRRKNFEYYIYL